KFVILLLAIVWNEIKLGVWNAAPRLHWTPVTKHTLEEPTKTMSSLPRFQPQTTDELPRDLVELAAAIEALPAPYRSQLEPLAARVIESTRRRRRILSLVQEALSQLRLDMKYLVFDLEATRRERDMRRESPGRDSDDE